MRVWWTPKTTRHREVIQPFFQFGFLQALAITQHNYFSYSAVWACCVLGSQRAVCRKTQRKQKQIAYRFLCVPLLSIPQPYLCNGIFISEEYSKNNVAHSNWLHKAFCYILVFVYWLDKWWRLLWLVCEGILTQRLVEAAILRGKFRDSVLCWPAAWFIYLSHISAEHTTICWWYVYEYIHGYDMKAITLHKIWVILWKKIDQTCLLKLHFSHSGAV